MPIRKRKAADSAGDAPGNIHQLGERLRQCRKREKMTQEEVALELGIHRSTYAYYESGHTEPSNEVLEKLVQLFGVTYDDLLGTGSLDDLTLTLNDRRTKKEHTADAYLERKRVPEPDPPSVIRSCGLSPEETEILVAFRSMDPDEREALLLSMRDRVNQRYANPEKNF